MNKLQGLDEIRLSSREVAEMMEVRHDSFMRKIKGIEETLTDHKIVVSDYWIESTYNDPTGRTLREYLISKKGCELLAHKSTGQKGILFTIKYMEKFNAMEKALLTHKPIALSPMEQLKLQYKVLETHEEKILKMEQQLESMEISPMQKKGIQREKNIRIRELIGGKKSEAYKDKSFRARVYAELGRQYLDYFEINSYEYTPKNKFNEALELIKSYNLSAELSMELKKINNQISFNN